MLDALPLNFTFRNPLGFGLENIYIRLIRLCKDYVMERVATNVFFATNDVLFFVHPFSKM